jgi:hypothetical protein
MRAQARASKEDWDTGTAAALAGGFASQAVLLFLRLVPTYTDRRTVRSLTFYYRWRRTKPVQKTITKQKSTEGKALDGKVALVTSGGSGPPAFSLPRREPPSWSQTSQPKGQLPSQLYFINDWSGKDLLPNNPRHAHSHQSPAMDIGLTHLGLHGGRYMCRASSIASSNTACSARSVDGAGSTWMVASS